MDQASMLICLVIHCVEQAHGLRKGCIPGRSRRREVVIWRHYAMFLAHQMGASYGQIAAVFNRHHATVMEAVRKFETMRRDKGEWGDA